jgi:hypothetical protein
MMITLYSAGEGVPSPAIRPVFDPELPLILSLRVEDRPNGAYLFSAC